MLDFDYFYFVKAQEKHVSEIQKLVQEHLYMNYPITNEDVTYFLDENHIADVVLHEQMVIGFSVFSRRAADCYVWEILIIHPSFQKVGLGTFFANHVLQKLLVEKNEITIIAECWSHPEDRFTTSEKLFKKMDFVEALHFTDCYAKQCSKDSSCIYRKDDQCYCSAKVMVKHCSSVK